MEKHFIIHNGKKIEFELIRKRVKNINLRTRSDMSVTVSADKRVPVGIILDFVRKKAHWISKNQDKYHNACRHEVKVKDKEYVTGDKFMILGREICLNIIEGKKEEIVLKDDLLEIKVKEDADIAGRRNLVGKYYKALIDQVYTESLERMIRILGLQFVPEIKVRHMVSRWGSCAVNRKRISLNFALIYTPLICIDYVVLHELLHFKHPGHNKIFYANVAQHMPDWKERKKILDGVALRDISL